MTEDRPLTWGEIYERLARRPDRPDARAWEVLGERVRAWTGDADLADETCAEVWRTFNLARGGASFEGFVQGRLVAVTRRNNPDPHPALPLSANWSLDPHPTLRCAARISASPTSLRAGGLGGGLLACLEELRARNPNHHRMLALLYEDRVSVEEAAEHLGMGTWMVRSLAARARAALAQCLGRRSGCRAGRSPAPPRRQPKGRPRRGGRPH